MRRKILDLKNNTQVEVLKVPWFPQQEIEWTCLVNSIKMCLEYMKNTYGNPIIRDIVPNMSIDEIMRITNTRRFTGTNVDYQLIKNLNTKIEGIKFSLEENIDLNKLSKKLEKGIPSILIYNCQFLTMGIRGAGHAGVIIGITESDIIVNNPCLGSEYFISHENFAPAWELEYNQAILLEPNPQTKLGSEGK